MDAQLKREIYRAVRTRMLLRGYTPPRRPVTGRPRKPWGIVRVLERAAAALVGETDPEDIR